PASPRATGGGTKRFEISAALGDREAVSSGSASFGPRATRAGNSASPFHVESLLGRCMGDAALCRKILHSFSTRGPQQRVAVEQSLAVGDLTALAEAAHSLKG